MANDTPTKNSSGSKALHWSAIRDIRVASDIAGAGASGEFADPYGATPDQIYGAAIGVPNAGNHSGYGLFTDLNGNTICIATESRPAWGMIKAKNLLGKDPYIINIPRNIGEGGAFEANAFMIAGINRSFGDYGGWSEIESSEISGGTTVTKNGTSMPRNPNFPTGLQLQPYNTFPALLEQIEQTGRKFDRPIVILNSGSPVTLSSVLSQFLSTILMVARPFASLIGIPPAMFDTMSMSLQEVVTTGKFSIGSLANVSQLIVPVEYRNYLPSAAKIYSKIDSGNYLGAMQELGVSSDNIVGTAKKLLGGDLSSLLTSTKLPYSELLGKAQSVFQMDTLRSITASVRSGSVMTALTDAGTMTRVPILQNLLATTTAETLVGAIPNVADVFSSAINETRDISTPDLHKGALQLSLGQMVGSDTFDVLTITGLKERANTVLEAGSPSYILPSIIPSFKQFDFAKLIADEVGIPVRYNGVNGAVTIQNPNESSKEWS